MCGRFTQTKSQQSVLNKFLVKVLSEQIERENKPRYNIAPSQQVPVVLKEKESGAGRQLLEMKWGLVPSWSNSSQLKFNTINARAEGVESSPVYRNAFKQTRCVVPASGYYEWKAGTSPKQPYYIYPEDRDDLFAMAGLWDEWSAPDGSVLKSFTLMTTAANSFISPVHHRMPVLLQESEIDEWLGGKDTSSERLKSLMRPSEQISISMHPVSPIVNKVANDSATNLEVYEPLEFDF